MILSSLKLKNFRIHIDIELEFSGNLNYIVGNNGLGKTSILESIYYLCTTKSFDAKNDSEVVNFGKENFEVDGKFSNLTEDEVRVMYVLKESKKYFYMNGKQINRTSEIIGKFPVVLLSPADHSITLGVPGERRKFIDSVISQASSTYLNNLMDYNRTLRHRSSLLSKIKENRSSISYDELDAWTHRLVETGTELIEHRISFVHTFISYVKDSYMRIMNEEEHPAIEYFYLNGIKKEDIKKQFISQLKEKREEELRRAKNVVGPHRDDFVFYFNGKNLRTFGSQGQHKTFQTVLRFAEFFYLKDVTGKKPIFLLDDVFGELDASRANKISDYLKEVGQTFVTLTDFGNFKFLKKDSDDRLIKLGNGVVSYA